MNDERSALISIVIPAYNVEPFIERCIHSLCMQTYTNIEILLVYTESEDNTESVCRKLALEDERIILRKRTGVSGGVSDARNIALELAKGEYIAFVDADDYVEPDYLEALQEYIQGRDISICGFDRVKGSDGKPELLGQDTEYGRNELVVDILCDNTVGGYLWNKLFRADIIKSNHICFHSELSVGEDMVFLASYMGYAQRGYYCNKILYHYRLNENSALQKMYTTGVFEQKKLSNMQASRYIAEELEQESGAVKDAVAYRMVRTGMWTMFNMLKCDYYDKDVLKDIRNSMKGNVWTYCRNKNTKFVEGVTSICISISPYAFWRVARFLMNLLPQSALQGYVN